MIVSPGDTILALKDVWNNIYVRVTYIGRRKDQPNYCYIQLENGNYVLTTKDYLFAFKDGE